VHLLASAACEARNYFVTLRIVTTSATTATFVAVVDPGNTHFISIRQVSLPVDFSYFANYKLIRT